MDKIKMTNPVTKATWDINTADQQSFTDKGWTLAQTPAATAAPINSVTSSQMTNVVNNNSVAQAKTAEQTSNNYLKRVQDTYSKVGGNTVANEAFIQGVAQAKYGRKASADELAKVGTNQYGMVGATVNDVLKRFGLLDQMPNYGLAPAQNPQISPEKGSNSSVNQNQVSAQPKTVERQIQDLITSKFDTTATNDQYDIPEKSEAVNTLKGELDQLKNTLDYNQVLQTAGVAKTKEEFYANKENIENQVIPMGEINKQLSILSDETNISLDKESIAAALTNATNTYRYNSKLIEYNVALGDLQNAQAMVQQAAQDFKDYQTMQLNLLQFQNQINQQDKELLQQDVNRQYDMALQGYTYIENPTALKQLAVKKGTDWVEQNTIKIAGKIYIKPQGITETPNVEIIGQIADEYGNTKNVYGYWDSATQSFKQVSGFGDNSGNVNIESSGIENYAKSFGGTITQGFDTPVSYFADGRTTHSGYDIAGKMNQDVPSPVTGTVVKAQSTESWGNSLVVQDAQGNQWRLAHFNSINPAYTYIGAKVNMGDILGKLGNTGYVLKGDGSKPTFKELADGAGTHLHLEIKDASGNFVNIGAQQTQGVNVKAQQIAQEIFNGTRTTGVKDLPTKQREQVDKELSKLREAAKSSGDIEGLIRASAGGKDVDNTFMQSFEKAVNVVYQINDLQATVDKEATGPITGIIRSNNPYDVKAQLIKAQLQAIVPNLARGIYGEVGVLTDNDIKNYAQTLPNLKNVEEARDLILGATIRSVQRSIENKLKVAAGAGRDVSGLLDVYTEVKSTADELLRPFNSSNKTSGVTSSGLKYTIE